MVRPQRLLIREFKGRLPSAPLYSSVLIPCPCINLLSLNVSSFSLNKHTHSFLQIFSLSPIR